MTTSNAFTSPFKRVEFIDRLPRAARPAQELLIYDRVLAQRVPGFDAWSRRFAARYAVRAGEELKDMAQLEPHLRRIAKLAEGFSRGNMRVVAVGGGSVGDFAGFVASVWKRGVELEMWPSTWLAAVDSAHGGKTALNLGAVKNVVGTFYPAARVVICRELLDAQPPARAREALSEMLKVAIIDAGARAGQPAPWAKALVGELAGVADFGAGSLAEILARYLPHAIRAKYRVVERDPFERRGIRAQLNLGHSLGHALELHAGLSHGEAIAWGLDFALRWSARKKLLPAARLAEWKSALAPLLGSRPKPLSSAQLTRALRADKKFGGDGRLQFVFAAGWGQVRPRAVTLAEFMAESRAQGWLRK